MSLNFRIQDKTFNCWMSDDDKDLIHVKSSPRPYSVEFRNNSNEFQWIEKELNNFEKPLIFIDKKVKDELLTNLNFHNIPTFIIEAIEENKDITTVLRACEFLNINAANRGSMLFVIGGGIVQDIGAFSASMFKRGIPWIFIPTTLLSQADSCLGGKTAVNSNKTKNLLGLFSAPRKVLIDTKFNDTLSYEDKMSGLGEIYRLLITGGNEGLRVLNQNIDKFMKGSTSASRALVSASLKVKKEIVEFDEFELDIRRSMNYGHSIGHAVEALSEYKIPHGVGVAIGIIVENRMSFNRKCLSAADESYLFQIGLKIIPKNIWLIFAKLKIEKILPFLASDKKVEGSALKLVSLNSIGDMKFVNLQLDEKGLHEVSEAFNDVITKAG